MNTKQKTMIGIVITVVLVTIVLAVQFSMKENASDANEEAIKAVVNNIFSSPNDEMISLYNDMLDKADQEVLSSAPGQAVSFDSTMLDKKLDETYSGYIAKDWYESFVNKFYTEFITYSIAGKYDIDVNSIDITQDSRNPINYSFTVYLSYGPVDGSKEDIKIKGSAQFAKEEGKLSFIRFFDSDLIVRLRNSL